MIYLSSFALSDKKVKNPNLYPYSVFQDKDCDPFVFAPITILYGDNGCGKSTLLNIIAQKINAKGYETYAYGQYYIQNYVEECRFDTGEDDTGRNLSIPAGSLYMKSEDVLYEIKKIQQEEALEQGYVYEQVRRKGMRKDVAQEMFRSTNGRSWSTMQILKFAQEKYSNGETAMQMLTDILEPDNLYLLDEPEVSLSPQNQVKLAEEINQCARFLGCQFIIATHSPFLLSMKCAKIYDLDEDPVNVKKWTELENVRTYFDLFMKHKDEFQSVPPKSFL